MSKKLLQAAAGTAAAAGGGGASGPNSFDVFASTAYVGMADSLADVYVKTVNTNVALGNDDAGSSVRFNDYNNNYLYTTDSTAQNIFTGIGSSGDFTAEAFVLRDCHNEYDTGWHDIFTWQSTNGNNIGLLHNETYGLVAYNLGASSTSLSSGSSDIISDSDGLWVHVAIVRESGTISLYKDGSRVATESSNTFDVGLNTSNKVAIGAYPSGSEQWDGHISNVRYSNIARYSGGSYTVPTAEFENDSNTRLLMCQGSDPFTDQSDTTFSGFVKKYATSSTSVDYGRGPEARVGFGPFSNGNTTHGLVWTKRTDATQNSSLIDTVRGGNKTWSSDSSAAEATITGSETLRFHGKGYSIAAKSSARNADNAKYNSWTFKKQEKFFDIVTYTGNGTAGHTVSHELGSVPGFIIIKNRDQGDRPVCYHRKAHDTAPEDKYLFLDSTSAAGDAVTAFNDTAPTDTEFTLGTSHNMNANNENYVAYLFAHNDGDGIFGPNGNGDLIKCGSYTGNASAVGPKITLGFEPQFFIIKNRDATGGWFMIDTTMGIAPNGVKYVYADSNVAEDSLTGNQIAIHSDGFQIYGTGTGINASNEYIFVAIGKHLKTVDNAADVHQQDEYTANDNTGSDPQEIQTPFDIDVFINTNSGSYNHSIGNRVVGGGRRMASSLLSNSEFNWAINVVGYSEPANYGDRAMTVSDFWGSTPGDKYNYLFARARSFLDVVGYRGTGAARTIPHKLGVAPEMMWVRSRDSTTNWRIWHKDFAANERLQFDTSVKTTTSTSWNNTLPTDSVFSVGADTNTNKSGDDYEMYLWATLDGVSKVGSYEGTGASNDIDCGFSNGASLVIIKNIDSVSDWYIWDSDLRGIVAGSEAFKRLNTTDSEDSSYDIIDPLSSGFNVSGTSTAANKSGDTYIFYAIAKP